MTHTRMPVLCLGTALALVTAHAQSTSIPTVEEVGTPKFTSVPGSAPLADARTIPHWSFQATDPSNGQTYELTMVGGNPADDSSTTVASAIIPLRLNFANGASLDGTTRAGAVVASPIFSEYHYSAQIAGGDDGQYGDVFMRAQFDEIGSGYHVRLGAPVVFPTVTIDVPRNQGVAVRNRRGVLVGLVDITWFSSRLQNLMGQLHLDPTTLPVFLTDNSMLYLGNNPADCCVIGYHGAPIVSGLGGGSVNSKGNANVNTFIYAAYTTPGTFAGAVGIQDIHALSHEVAEWLDDPFVHNFVQPWLTPTAPQYGCTPLLETGDPVVGIWFPLAGNPDVNAFNPLGLWHPEDEVFWPWFLRQSPSSSFAGHYTLMGSDNPFPGFSVPATGCQ